MLVIRLTQGKGPPSRRTPTIPLAIATLCFGYARLPLDTLNVLQKSRFNHSLLLAALKRVVQRDMRNTCGGEEALLSICYYYSGWLSLISAALHLTPKYSVRDTYLFWAHQERVQTCFICVSRASWCSFSGSGYKILTGLSPHNLSTCQVGLYV